MILLTKINDKSFVLNAELIEMIEETPDTIITLVNGKRYIVKESVEICIDKVVEYKQGLYNK